MAEKTFKSGEVIFKEGTYEPCMYELLTGTVGIYARYGQENEKRHGSSGMTISSPRI